MDQQTFRDILSGRAGGLAPAVVRSVLLVASWLYSAAMQIRRRAYGRGVIKSHPAEVPVICIGNITTGGTGKTPMAAWIAKQLKAAGRKPAVLTRGYKPAGGTCDEAELLKTLCGAAVIINGDRVAGAAEAVEAGADVCVMDDGFQHLRLRRDLDIVLIDATEPFGYGHCLPRGMLREPLSALGDAEAIVITRSDAVSPDDLEGLCARLAGLAPQASIHLAVHRPARIIDENGKDLALDALAERRIFAFAGIGNPQHFFRTLSELRARLLCRYVFDDHIAYTSEMMKMLTDRAGECQAELMVTTEKDYVKLAGFSLALPLWRLVVEMEVVEGGEELLERVFATAGVT